MRGTFPLLKICHDLSGSPPGSPPSGDTALHSCKDSTTSALRNAAVYSVGKKKKVGNCCCRYDGNSIVLICDATLSDDKYVPTCIPLRVFFALLPSVRILNMARIDFFLLPPPIKSNFASIRVSRATSCLLPQPVHYLAARFVFVCTELLLSLRDLPGVCFMLI